MYTNKNLLLVSYLFPPNAAVGGQRVARFCRYLPLYGVTPAVLAARLGPEDRRDESLLIPGLEVHSTEVKPTLLDTYARWRTRSHPPDNPAAGASPTPQAGAPEGSRGFVRRQVLAWQLTPDLQRGWRAPAVRAGRDLLRSRQFDVILSSGPPWTSHLAARKLQHISGLPWIADFRDPWRQAPAPGAPAWKPRLDARLESACVRESALVICNTEQLRQNFLARYPALPRERFAVITNGFEELPGPASATPLDDPPTCLHLGSLYGRRRIDTFCRALDLLLERGDLRPGQLRIRFVGDNDENFLKVAAASAPRATACGMIEFLPAVPRARLRDLMGAARLLLLFQGGYRLQVPAKFFEYLPTGKPMFAVTEEGALSGLLDATGGGLWASPDDPGVIAAQFARALRLRATPPEAALRRWTEVYHYRALAGQLAQHIRTLSA